MSELHPMLRRQLRRLGIDAEAAPSAERWHELLARVGQTYRDADEERYTVERAFTISSREMQELYERLERRSESELARSHAMLEAAFESMRDGVLVVGGDREIISFNRRFGALWRIPGELLETRDDAALLGFVLSSLRDPDEFIARVEYLYAQPLETSEEEIFLRDGRCIHRVSTPVVAGDGTVHGRMWVFRDVTERLRAEESLRAAKEAAESASRAKTQFLANMSHELRTPLNAIIGFAQVLGGQSSAFSSTQRQYLAYVLRAGEHMLALVNDLLDLRRVEEGRVPLDLDAHPVGDVVDAAVSLVQPLLDERGHAFAVTHDPELGAVWCDPRAMVQVLVNLLSNAAKYTAPGGRIGLRAVRDGDQARFEVEDTGFGIAPEDIEALFTYFNHVGAKDRHRMRGSGVGLALTRALVERMGGSIDVSSVVSQGSVFRILIPAGPAEVPR